MRLAVKVHDDPIANPAGGAVHGGQPATVRAAEVQGLRPRAAYHDRAGEDRSRLRADHGAQAQPHHRHAIRMVRRVLGRRAVRFSGRSPSQIDALIREGKIAAETRTEAHGSGFGVQVRAGAPQAGHQVRSTRSSAPCSMQSRSAISRRARAASISRHCWSASASPRPSRRRSRGRIPTSCRSLWPRARSNSEWSSSRRS